MAPNDLRVTTRADHGATVVVVEGDVDAATAKQLEGELLTALLGVSAQTDLVVDLAGVPFMDSSGLRVLIDAVKSCRNLGATLIVRNPSGTVGQLLDITAMTDVIAIDND
jgi:anti-sigma B factor antagonist